MAEQNPSQEYLQNTILGFTGNTATIRLSEKPPTEIIRQCVKLGFMLKPINLLNNEYLVNGMKKEITGEIFKILIGFEVPQKFLDSLLEKEKREEKMGEKNRIMEEEKTRKEEEASMKRSRSTTNPPKDQQNVNTSKSSGNLSDLEKRREEQKKKEKKQKQELLDLHDENSGRTPRSRLAPQTKDWSLIQHYSDRVPFDPESNELDINRDEENHDILTVTGNGVAMDMLKSELMPIISNYRMCGGPFNFEDIKEIRFEIGK